MENRTSRPGAAPLLELRPGDPERVGPYRIEAKIGEGGMGAVYLGRGPDARPVAVKVVRAELAGDRTFLARFHDEAANATRVASFCTAQVLEHGADLGMAYLVTEYIDGPSLLQQVSESGTLTPGMLHGVAVGVAAALVAIHAAGLVHRDLKPSNVLLSMTGPRVIDFGIARALETGGMHTRTGQVVGTPGWIAPEQILTQQVSPAVDVFAWGCLVAFAAHGRNPFGQGTFHVLAARAVHAEPELGDLPGSLAGLVRSALAKDPARRPSAQELLLALVGGSSEVDVSTTLNDSWSPPPQPSVTARDSSAAAAPPRPGTASGDAGPSAASARPGVTAGDSETPAAPLPGTTARDGEASAPSPRPTVTARDGEASAASPLPGTTARDSGPVEAPPQPGATSRNTAAFAAPPLPGADPRDTGALAAPPAPYPGGGYAPAPFEPETERWDGTRGSMAGHPPGLPDRRARGGRKGPVAAGAAVLLLAVAAAGVYLLTRPDGGPGGAAADGFPTEPMLVRIDAAPGWPKNCKADIGTYKPGSAAPVPLVTGPSCDMLPELSPKGDRVAFTRRNGGSTEAWVVDAGGGDPRLVTDRLAGGRVAWSPDGRRLAYVGRRDGISQLFAITLGTSSTVQSSTVQLTHDRAAKDDPMWSSKGRLAFWSKGDGVEQLYSLDPERPSAPWTRITRDGVRAVDPEWSPDGTRIAYARGGHPGDIWIIGADGSGASRLTTGAEHEMDPDWSRDGGWITYVRGATATPVVRAIRADGTGDRPLTPAGHTLGHPNW